MRLAGPDEDPQRPPVMPQRVLVVAADPGRRTDSGVGDSYAGVIFRFGEQAQGFPCRRFGFGVSVLVERELSLVAQHDRLAVPICLLPGARQGDLVGAPPIVVV